MTNQHFKFWLRLRVILFVISVFYFSSCGEQLKSDSLPSINSDNSAEETFKILILGDSLTEGYGVSESEAYPSLLEEKLNIGTINNNDNYYQVINGGISGSTTSGGVSRIEWFLKSNPNFLILALGGNDGLRGIPIEKIKINLTKVVIAAKSNNIPILLAGMKIPPNYSFAYSQAFSALFPQISEEHNIPLIPFLLKDVGGDPEMNLPDRIHPNSNGHIVIAETVYQYLIKELSPNP
jgi:acyl-CoA thioesterase-1